MNREILFRGKSADNGEWVEGFYFKWHSGNSYLLIEKVIEIDNPKYPMLDIEFIPVVPETVGHYTGLTDKNGTKIFEGDIVVYVSNNEQAVIEWGEYLAGFMLSFNGWCSGFDDYLPDEIEVIGNIFDNPELLEVKK